VVNTGDPSVSVIDSQTNTVIGAPIPVEAVMLARVAVNPALNLVYLTSAGSSNVSVIDGATNAVVGTPISVHLPIGGIAVNTTTGRVYVPQPLDDRVSVLGVPLTISTTGTTAVGKVTMTWSSLFVPTGSDFVGLFEPGAPNTSPLSKTFTNGTTSAGGPGLGDGSVDLSIPGGLVPGHTYEARLVRESSSGTIAQVQTALIAAANDSFTTGPSTTLSVQAPGILANDTDPRSSTLKAIVVTGPAHGTLTLQPDGAFTYTPTALFAGTDSFTYRASANADLPSVATVTITVTAAPVGTNDAYSVVAGSVLTVPAPGVLANDTDADSPSLRAAVGTNPAHGNLSLQPDGAFTYTPAVGFAGTDTFTYLASDQTSVSLPVTVTVTVTPASPGPGDPGSGTPEPGTPGPGTPGPGTPGPGTPGSGTPGSGTPGPGPNGAPTATPDNYSMVAGTTLAVPAPGVLSNDTAPGSPSPSLQASVVTAPAHGALALKPDGRFAYSPNSDFFGTDTFTYRASDRTSQSAPATVSIVVLPTECAPRPRVKASPAPAGNRLLVRVEATPLSTQQSNALKEVRFGAFQNAKVTLNGQPIASGQTVTPPANATVLDFTVERVTPGQATTVPFTVVDSCGEWPTFVGGGPGAGF